MITNVVIYVYNTGIFWMVNVVKNLKFIVEVLKLA